MTLAPISGVDRSTFRWLRERDHPAAFSLSSGETTVATLEWARTGGSLATLRSATGEWTVKRGGFLNPLITARVGPVVEARLTVHLNYHEIDVAGGRSYRFHRAGVLIPAWKVTTPSGTELVHVEPVREGRHLAAGAVIVSDDGKDSPDLLLLIALAWYFIVQAWFEDETVEALAPLEGPDAPVRYEISRP